MTWKMWKKTHQNDKNIIRNSVKDPKKTSVDLQRDLFSSVEKRLIEDDTVSRKTQKKYLMAFII